jgi:N-acetylglucosaminyl-diphospho-decaprenol L-rhamnosyltransferase
VIQVSRVDVRPRTGAPRVAVIVVCYNSSAVIGDCLRAIGAATQGVRLSAVVVADNASTDTSVDLVRAVAAETGLPVSVLPLGRNAGYAAAINAGVAALAQRPDHVLVLNPDARPMPASLAALVHAADQPGVGIAVPRLLAPDGSVAPSLRRPPSIRRALAEAVLGGRRAGRLGALSEVITDPHAYELPGPVAWATGAAMLVSMAAWTEIGPWDESFLLYSEETEFALRAADRGWSVWYEPAAVMRHIGGESGTNPVLWALLTVNRVRLYRRRHGPGRGLAFQAAVILGEAIRAATGRRTARAALLALLRPSKRLRALPR